MNLSMLFAVVYLAVTAGGNSATDAYKALGIVGVWLALGVVWFIVNTARQGHKVTDSAVPRRDELIGI
jgi:hypothetical protein